jgi:hypothetical protein
MKRIVNVIILSFLLTSLTGTVLAADNSDSELHFSCQFEGIEDYVCELVSCEGNREQQEVLVKIAISHALPEHELKLEIWDAFTKDGEPYDTYIKTKTYSGDWKWTQYETTHVIRTERPKYIEFMINSVLPSQNQISVALFKYSRYDISFKQGFMVIKNIPITWN